MPRARVTGRPDRRIRWLARRARRLFDRPNRWRHGPPRRCVSEAVVAPSRRLLSLRLGGCSGLDGVGLLESIAVRAIDRLLLAGFVMVGGPGFAHGGEGRGGV